MKTINQASILFLCFLASLTGGIQTKADPLPTGGKNIRGDATIQTNANSLTIRSSQRSVIEWQTFNIQAGKRVDFLNNAAVLNYVVPNGGASTISGTLTATDSLVLINPQGISITNGANLNVTSLLLSTGTLSSGAIDAFVNGATYGSSNAPLISIDLPDSSGSISIDGTIKSIDNGDIAVVAPVVSFGPNADIEAFGPRSSSDATDGVNITVNGVAAEGSLWVGTTALAANNYTAGPGLPTGFGFLRVSGTPSPQDVRFDLAGTYDVERFVIGTAGAKSDQFDNLFFSPNFRAHHFYVYDGAVAVADAQRESTNGGPLQRKMQHLVSSSGTTPTPIVKLESDILGLHLPAGSQLLNAEHVRIDYQTHQIISGTLTLSPGTKAAGNKSFTDHFGAGNIEIKFDGQNSTLTGSNGTSGKYDVATGIVTWKQMVQGQPTTSVEFVPGAVQITQGSTTPPFVPPTTSGTTGSYTVKEGGWYHGNHGQGYYGPTPDGCNHCHYKDPVLGNIVYWKGHFFTGTPGKPQFIEGGANGQQPTHVVYQVAGKWYVTSASNFESNNAPNPTQLTSTTPGTYQTVEHPGHKVEQTFSQAIPVAGTITPPKGTSTSHWERQLVAVGTYGQGPSGLSPGNPTTGPSFTGTGFTGQNRPQNPGTGSNNNPQVVYGFRPSFSGFSGYSPANPGTGTNTNTGTGGNNNPQVGYGFRPSFSGFSGYSPANPNTNTNKGSGSGTRPRTLPQGNTAVTPTTAPSVTASGLTGQNRPPTQGTGNTSNTSNSTLNPSNQAGNETQNPTPQPIASNTPSTTEVRPLIRTTANLPNSYEYQIPDDVLQKLGRDADLQNSRLSLPGGAPLPDGVEFEAMSETITIRRGAGVSLPLDVELSAPTSIGVRTILLTVGEP